MMVSRFQCSNIIIGNHCTFNSSSRFNYRGLNHRCILQTAAENAIISIGDYCGFSGVSIIAAKEVVIGNHVMVGANTGIADWDDHSDRIKTIPIPVHIEDNVFIGMDCTILKGVTIGKNSIIGAGSIVTKDIPANVITVGNPCKVIRKIQD